MRNLIHDQSSLTKFAESSKFDIVYRKLWNIFVQSKICSDSSSKLDEKHPIKILDCHIRKIEKIKLHMNEHETFCIKF